MRIICLLIIAMALHTSNAQNYYFINAENGLNVRSAPNLNGEKVAKIPFGVMVEKIADTNYSISIEDNGEILTDKFVKIKYTNYPYLVNEETKSFIREGYVFNAYLKKKNSNNILNISKISEQTYKELLKTAIKEHPKPQKINNLNTIKNLLKGRVKWLTKTYDDGYKREDIIQEISTDNGQVLKLNVDSYEDCYFDSNYNGYFPEYDILLLSGGHSSDVSFAIKTGETQVTAGNPEYIITSPNGTHRLNGTFGGQECVTYFLQENKNGRFTYLTEFDWDYDICTFKQFYWLNEEEFMYTLINYKEDSVNGVEEYFKGKIKS